MSRVVTIQSFQKEREMSDQRQKLFLQKAKGYKLKLVQAEIRIKKLKEHTGIKLRQNREDIEQKLSEVQLLKKERLKLKDRIQDMQIKIEEQSLTKFDKIKFEDMLQDLAKPIAESLLKKYSEDADIEAKDFLESFI